MPTVNRQPARLICGTEAATALTRQITEPHGGTTIVVYERSGRQTATAPDGTVTTLDVGPDPRWGLQAPVPARLVEQRPSGATSTWEVSRDAIMDEFDEQGDPFAVERLVTRVNANGAVTETVYDRATRTDTTTEPEGRQVVTTLDARGRPVTWTGEGLDPVRLTYDERGRLAEVIQGEQSWTYTYDATNRLTTSTNAAGETIDFAWDAAGRLASQETPSGRSYAFGYDADGNRTAVGMPSGAVHELGYTGYGLLSAYIAPGNPPLVTAYDADGRRSSVTLPGGRRRQIAGTRQTVVGRGPTPRRRSPSATAPSPTGRTRSSAPPRRATATRCCSASMARSRPAARRRPTVRRRASRRTATTPTCAWPASPPTARRSARWPTTATASWSPTGCSPTSAAGRSARRPRSATALRRCP